LVRFGNTPTIFFQDPITSAAFVRRFPCARVLTSRALCGFATRKAIPAFLRKFAQVRLHQPDAQTIGLHIRNALAIAIADTRVPAYEKAQVEVARTQLTCRVDGKDFVMNDDCSAVRGGLYRRFPWFGADAHEPIPLVSSKDPGAVVLRVGSHPNRHGISGRLLPAHYFPPVIWKEVVPPAIFDSRIAPVIEADLE
jgi:hypothetical protein